MGIHTTIKEKTIRTQFEDFIDCRTIDYGDIIEELSTGMTLKAGTVIATGTPSGVALGMAPEVQKYLKSGDVVRCEIDRIGVLENTIA